MGRKIVLLGPYPPPYGGVAIFTASLFDFTKDQGVKLWAAGEKLPSKPNVSPINYRRLGLIPLMLEDGFRARIIDSFHFLVEYPHPMMVPVWVLLKLVLRFEWVKVVHDGSLPSRYDGFNLIQKLLFRIIISSVDEFAVVNDRLNSWLREAIKVRQKVTTINALLPLQGDQYNAPLPAEIERAITPHKKRIVSTGIFIPSYGFKHVAESIERIRRETGEDIGLILIDGAFMNDPAYRSEVLHQRHWITVLEKVPHPQVLQIFKRADLFVRGFRYEGYGLSRIEAIWCGIPVVAAQGEESRGMLLYDFGDEEELIRHIKKALFDPPRLEIQKWADQFQREAEENLRRWVKLIGLEQ
jgi:glycogen synthase